MQIARGLVPITLVNEVVPIGDLVIDRASWRAGRDRASALAIGHAAIHAARRLDDVVLLRQRQHEFAPVVNALGDRLVVTVLTLVFEKAGDLTHCDSFLVPVPLYSAAMAAALSSLSARRYSTGMTLRNFGYQIFHSARILAAITEPVKCACREIRWCSRCASNRLMSDMMSTMPCASRSRDWWKMRELMS